MAKDKEAGKKEKDPHFDKEKAKLNKFDPRGVQTLFRTLSRNHYNLLKMVDNKASIILTMNSIIISLLMGALYVAPETEKIALESVAKTIIGFSMASMVFALLSMLPHKYIGPKFQKSSYMGSLYAANFSNQSLEQFTAEMQRVLNNGHSVYDEMIKDLYFLGRVIANKQQMVWLSVIVFLGGLAIVGIYLAITLFSQ